MIYLTGDTHGDFNRILDFVCKNGVTKNDIIIILGDVGLNYYGNDRGDRRWKRKLNSLGVQFFGLHGNHERRPESLSSYITAEWNGGTVYVEADYPNLAFARDGELYCLDGHQVITLGGAYSVDKYYRLERGLAWFNDEQPSNESKARAEKNLGSVGWKVDYVFSHTCPERYVPIEAFIPGLDQSTIDRSTEQWLGEIESRIAYKRWFCGHWHIDKQIDKMTFLMNSFIPMTWPPEND